MAKRQIAIGAYVGGKGFKCAAFDLNTKKIIEGSSVEGRMDTDAGNRQIIPLWSLKIKGALRSISEDELVGIGFAIPGPFNYKKGIGGYQGVPKYESLNGCNISEELNKRLQLKKDIEFRYVNDAIGFALGQDWTSPIDNKKGLSIIIDAGLGSAYLTNQLPVFQGNGVPPKGATYKIPFNGGIADDYFSIRGLVNEYKKMGHTLVGSPQRAIQRAAKTQADKTVFKQFGENFGSFLTPIIEKFAPEYISFGGTIGTQLEFFEEGLKSSISKDNLQVDIQIPTVGDDAFMYGAARLFDEQYWAKIKPLLHLMD